MQILRDANNCPSGRTNPSGRRGWPQTVSGCDPASVYGYVATILVVVSRALLWGRT